MADISASQTLTMGIDAVYLSKRPLPTAPTGYYDWQITTDPADDREGHSAVTNLVNRVRISPFISLDWTHGQIIGPSLQSEG